MGHIDGAVALRQIPNASIRYVAATQMWKTRALVRSLPRHFRVGHGGVRGYHLCSRIESCGNQAADCGCAAFAWLITGGSIINVAVSRGFAKGALILSEHHIESISYSTRVLICLLVAAKSVTPAAQAETVPVGVNVVGVDWASDQTQDALIGQLDSNGVKTIRTAIGGHDDRYTAFVIKAYHHGIGAVVITDPCAGNTQKHAFPADEAAGHPWGLSALSDADPDGFRKYFVAELTKLEAAGVHVTAFELGNELNTPRFNADFQPEHTSGRVLRLSDLNNVGDPEALSVANGYRAYVKVMAVLKDLRDHSQLNQKAPILTGMSANWGMPDHSRRGNGFAGAVSLPDSIEFLRQNGIDKLVDGYGVHFYPNSDPRQAAPARFQVLEQTGTLAGCKKSNKPCWMTEWGINNPAQSCPLDEAARAQVIRAERSVFKQYVDQGRLAILLYYSWSGILPRSYEKANPGVKEEQSAIFRCGALTEAGKLALSAM